MIERSGRSGIVRERRGAILVFVAVTGVVLMGFLTLTLDIGAGARQRRIAQTAADAAAFAGGQEIFRLQSLDTVNAAAYREANRNGFDNTATVVSYPPATGPHAGDPKYVEVVINKTISTLFGSIFNTASMSIQARGVAGVGTTNTNCVYSLNPSGSQSLLLNGNITANCGVAVNSTAPDAIYVKSGKDLDAFAIAVSGGTSGGGGMSPAPSIGATQAVNPLAYLTMPAVGACTFASTVVVSGTVNLDPGVYCGGISITNASNTANLSPGTYIIAGGGLTVTNSATINGTGVTFILTNGPGNNAAAYAGINFGNGCKANISAPTSGLFKGILMFQDPAAGLSGVTYVNTFACADDFPLVGTLYFPTQTAYFGGSNSDTQINGGLVALNVEVKEGTTLTMNQLPTSSSALLRVALVE